jgi:light-regulated signal transduction histidine kinase (bacteriophytochrome)
MHALAMSVYRELSIAGKNKKIILNIDALHQVPGDPSLLKQVWINLLDNAIKFSSQREHPIITITSYVEEKMIVYCIKDNGAGFDMLYIDKLFGVFQRLHSVRDYEGTGVGLAIVQRIIHKHGGQVWARGIVNDGAAFYFSLPIEHPVNQQI